MADNLHKIRIKDIAQMAGVSAGTVDRVLHGRGNVSSSAKQAVESVLGNVKYKPNLYLSSISMKKRYNIAITTPMINDGEYWEQIHHGIMHAIKEYNTIDIACSFFYYDQYDLFSCRATFDKLLKTSPDAVIIGPTFKDETIVLTNRLSDKKIPYVFVDSVVEGTDPLAFYSANQYLCGYLIAKLTCQICAATDEYVLFQAVRIGDESANNTILRKIGFMGYFKERGMEDRVHRMNFITMHPESNDQPIAEFFRLNPNVKGAAVLSSRGNIIADVLKRNGIKDVKMTCLDLTRGNESAIKEGNIDFLICQRPNQQGFLAVETLLKSLAWGNRMRCENYMPMDIITRENVGFYKEFSE